MQRPSFPEALKQRLRALASFRTRSLPSFLSDDAPLDLRIVSRTLLHAATVGVAAGFAGAAFYAGLEFMQRVLLEGLAGYSPLRADGERIIKPGELHAFRPWLLAILPALGGLGCGLLTRLAPETRGGGGDAMIEAFHHHDGSIPLRVLWIKPFASIATLGTGGAGGREGPTMQIGGALGALASRLLGVSIRERRVLMVAGVAAGISAVFRTPLGAALLAVEVLYRDGFESDALIPSVLASVISYAVVISLFGETTLFGRIPRFAFVPAHLPLFGLLALFVALIAVLFLKVFRAVAAFFERLRVPAWLKPALGGLLLGVLVAPLIVFVDFKISSPGQGIGGLGGGYGAVQMAISGSPWLPPGWAAVGLLATLGFVKVLAASFTIGSGGSAGDFAPSLAMGGLLGGAFGRAAALLIHDPRIQPGAFALVGMGTFYGGIAHTPLAALVLVCELAGNYDLLVPLMLAQGIAFVALRKRALYSSQLVTQQDSPLNRDTLLFEVLSSARVGELIDLAKRPICFSPHTPTAEILQRASEAETQEVFPVIDGTGGLVGLVTSAAVRVIAGAAADTQWAVAVDLMQAAVSVRMEDDLRVATELMVSHGLRELPVLDRSGRVLGLLDEADIAEVYLRASARAASADKSSPEAAS
jgi:CIC family chloride channel protein